MKYLPALLVLLLGVVFALVGTGCLTVWPHFRFVAPILAMPFVLPIAGFGLLAWSLTLETNVANRATVYAGIIILAVSCAHFLLPNLRQSTSTDAQTGMFEAFVLMATFPVALFFTLAALVVPRLASLIGQANEA